MLVSVVIPVYNGEEFLRGCLESVKACPSPEIECIVINDGSEDGTKGLCQEFSRKDARFRLVDKDNSGVSDSRNRGLAIAAGDYVFFLDADDYIDVTQWREILAHAAAGAFDMVAFGHCDLSASGDVNEKAFPEGCDAASALLTTTLLNTCWGKLLRREVISGNGLRFREALKTCEDAVFILDFVQKAKSFAMPGCCAIYHRIHPGGVMQRATLESKLSDFSALFERRLLYLSENNGEQYRKAMYRQSFSVITDLLRTHAGKLGLRDVRNDFAKAMKNPVVRKIMAGCSVRSLSPVYKKIEYALMSGGFYACMAAYFKAKGRLTPGSAGHIKEKL